MEVESTEPIEYTHPLLDPQCDQVDGKVYISGCLTLTNLNLSSMWIFIISMDSLIF